MIPIVLASVLVASGKNIWHPLILPVIVSVCLQVCVSECVPAYQHAGANAVHFFIEKKNDAVQK